MDTIKNKKSSQECPAVSRWKHDNYLLIETVYDYSHTLFYGWKYAFQQQPIWHLQAEKEYTFLAAAGYKHDNNKSDKELFCNQMLTSRLTKMKL